jgi:hypothetical protein
MAAKEVGAHIKKGDPVEKLSSEGPLDQNMGIGVDDNMTDPVFLESVRDEHDIFERAPVLGTIDFQSELGKESIKSLLGSNKYVTESIFLNPTGDGFAKMDDVATDRFAVSDAKWMDDREELIWKSPLMAQLQAKLNAMTHFMNDPSAVDFQGSMSDEEKRIVAQRARELAASLQDEALNQINSEAESAAARLRETVAATKERFMEYTVTSSDAIQAGGLTEGEVDELFKGGK